VQGRASGVKMAEIEAPISLYGVAVHPDCWRICLCYLHFAPENPEDGKVYLSVPALGVVPDKVQRAVKWLCVCECVMNVFVLLEFVI